MRMFIQKLELKSVVIVLALSGALGMAFIDKDQRNAFMTIAITATGGFFGAEIPTNTRRKTTDDTKPAVDEA